MQKKNEKAKEYKNIYDPLINLIEKGLDFDYREGGLMLYDSCFYPFNNWYERFLEMLKEEGKI